MTDYIKREDVLYQLNKQATIDGQPRAIRRAIRIVAEFPSADVWPVVRGEWLHKKITDDFHVVGQCSVCKERRRIDNFCPNCGADMREKADV